MGGDGGWQGPSAGGSTRGFQLQRSGALVSGGRERGERKSGQGLARFDKARGVAPSVVHTPKV